MSLDILKKKIKEQDTCGLIYLYGEEEYLKSHYYEQLRTQTTSVMTEFNISELSGEALDLNTLENLINSFPMMSDKRFIGVVDLEHKLLTKEFEKQLLKILTDLPEYLSLVFMDTVQKGGRDATLLRLIKKAGGLCAEVERPDAKALAAWGKKHFKSFDKEISIADMQYILQVADNDMLSLQNEIGKIATYARGDAVTRSDIDAVITRSLETNRFALSDAISKQDFQAALKIVGDLYAQNYEDMQVVGLIYRCITDLLHACWARENGISASRFAEDFGLHSYGAGKLMRFAAALNTRRLLKSLDKCVDCDVRLKSEAGDKREMVYALIGSLISCGSNV